MSPATYRRNPRAVWRATGHFLVAAVPPAAPTRVGGSAALVWAALAEPLTLDALVAALAVATGEPADRLRPDVLALLDALLPLDLVQVGE